MRHVVGHLSDLSHQLFNPVEHRVEVSGQIVPFVPGAAKWYPVGKPALHWVPTPPAPSPGPPNR